MSETPTRSFFAEIKTNVVRKTFVCKFVPAAQSLQVMKGKVKEDEKKRGGADCRRYYDGDLYDCVRGAERAAV